MDIRTNIVQKVTEALQGRADEEIVSIVQDVLVMQLNSYEVTERCTDVAVRDDSAEGVLKKFLATKRVEGMADKSRSSRVSVWHKSKTGTALSGGREWSISGLQYWEPCLLSFSPKSDCKEVAE